MEKIHLIKLNFKDIDFLQIKKIRTTVFHDELSISESELFDEYDHSCEHFLIFDGKCIVGSLRIVQYEKKLKLERMAILREFRGKNYGKNTISQIKEYYSALGFSELFLDSIFSIKNFYKKCGFIEKGEKFQRVGIDHIRMESTF
tara:strand:+ start:4057 stop:4491 length:435 start_codon:yes stop_codon:yes gene_type:complete